MQSSYFWLTLLIMRISIAVLALWLAFFPSQYACAEEKAASANVVGAAFGDLYVAYQSEFTAKALLDYCGFAELASKLPPTESERANFYLNWMLKPNNALLNPDDVNQLERLATTMNAGLKQGLSTGIGMSGLLSKDLTKESVCALAPGLAAALLEEKTAIED